MILSNSELRSYRNLVVLQGAYAQRGDSHKVMELQDKLENWIRVTAQSKIAIATGEKVDLSWSEDARTQYRERCATGLEKIDCGFEAWSAQQRLIEQWVSDYIQQGVFQVTIKIQQPKQ